MADRQLSDKLSSGELSTIKIGGASSDNLVLTTLEVDNKISNAEKSYDFSKVSGITINIDTYTEVNKLTVLNKPAGVYEYKFSMTFSYTVTTRSAYFRFSIDNGATWSEVAREPKDTTDKYVKFYAFPYNHTGGDINLIVEARCEDAADTLTIDALDIMAEQKS